MGEKKITFMAIKVDLDCEKCHKKIKKVLCSIPQVQNQVYNEKTNTVTITVYCCCPEKVMKKICCKGGKTVKSIQIIVPEKPKEKPKEPEKPKQPEKPKEPAKPKEPEKPKEPQKPKEPEKPKEPAKPKEPEKPKEAEKPKQPEKPKEPEKPKAPPVEPPPPVIVPVCPPPVVQPRTCCRECYEGHGYGPCYYGTPVPCYEGYGRPVYESWGGRGCYVSRCDYYLCEENPQGCTIM